MELIFVRHGLPERQTLDNAPADPGLSSVGFAQAAALGDWLAHEPIHEIVQSPARRARETAAPLAQRCGLSPSTVTNLNEFDAGSTSYVPVEEMRTSGDPRWELLRQGLLYGTPEEADRFRHQIVAAVEALIQANHGKRVVVVSHELKNRCGSPHATRVSPACSRPNPANGHWKHSMKYRIWS
jgi:probable phosphoglycerate mutase